jgi:hypothetical protein
MIIFGIFIGATILAVCSRLDGPANRVRLRAFVVGGIAFVALGICIAWLDDQKVLTSLLLSEWKAGGTWGIPFGYTLLLGSLLDWIFNRKAR